MIVKVDSPSQSLPDASSFTVIGDPGCDGLGGASLTAFAAALRASEGDFILVAGDLVPRDSDEYFRRVAVLADSLTDKPVYVVRGNHDGHGYAARLGPSEYLIDAKGFSIAVLDNGAGHFTSNSRELLRHALDQAAGPLHLAFHIPPPNRFHGDSMDEASWRRIPPLLHAGKRRLGWLLCGHVHSYFEDVVDGVPLAVTGGGGASMDIVVRVATPPHHVLEFRHGPDGDSVHRRHDISPGGQAGHDLELRKLLLQTLSTETNAFLHSAIRAAEAGARDRFRLARLYRAAAESQRLRAQTLYQVLFSPPTPLEALAGTLEEQDDVIHAWQSRMEAAERLGDTLAALTLEDSLAGAETYRTMFADTLAAMHNGDDDPGLPQCRVCESCGRLLTDAAPPTNCPVCGAPARRFKSIW